jgi:hypothetical protein
MKCSFGYRNDDLILTAMSELQDKLDRGEISSQEYFDAWDEQMAENERLHPGFHDRLYEHLTAKHLGEGVDADEFFALD